MSPIRWREVRSTAFCFIATVARTYLQTQAVVRQRPCDLLRACAVTRYYLASPRNVMSVVEQRGTLGACFLVARVYVVAFFFLRHSCFCCSLCIHLNLVHKDQVNVPPLALGLEASVHYFFCLPNFASARAVCS